MMPSMSQIDMVVWREEIRELQVCGNLEPRPGTAPSSEVGEFLVVVRQDGNVATLRETHAHGRWEFKVVLGPQARLTTGRPAVASAVVILREEPAGLEMLSWVQPVTIEGERLAADESQHVHFQPQAVDQPTGGTLTAERSISSSLAILRDDAAGEHYRWRQKVESVPIASHHLAS
jgi:hypothetical protein